MGVTSTTWHSTQPAQSARSGDVMLVGEKVPHCVASNLSMDSPGRLPRYWTWCTYGRFGKFSANSWEWLIISAVCRDCSTAIPMRGGSEDRGVCHESGIT